MKRLIFGLGTGRCGTASLAKILNNDSKITCFHEGRLNYSRGPDRYVLPWKVSRSKLLENLLMLRSADTPIVGDVGFYYLPYAGIILNMFEDSKFIIMKRDREATVHSYMAWTKGRNHWQKMTKPGAWRADSTWDPAYPKYHAKHKRDALRKYWDDYYKKVDLLVSKRPESFMCLDISCLNSDADLDDMFSFLNITPSKYSKHRIFNTNKDRGPSKNYTKLNAQGDVK